MARRIDGATIRVQGPPGPIVGRQPFVAGADLGGHRIVRVADDGRVTLASCADPDGIGTVLGLTLAAARVGSAIEVAVSGPVDESTWSFTPGPVYLGLDGGLTQEAPVAGVLLRIGTAAFATRLNLAFGDPYVFAT